MISGITNNDIKTYLSNCRRNKDEFSNNLTNIEGKIQELFKKVDALEHPYVDTSKYASVEDVNNIIQDVKETFEYLLQSTPREISDLKNTISELRHRIDELESQKHADINNNTESLQAKIKVPKLLVNVKKNK